MRLVHSIADPAEHRRPIVPASIERTGLDAPRQIIQWMEQGKGAINTRLYPARISTLFYKRVFVPLTSAVIATVLCCALCALLNVPNSVIQISLVIFKTLSIVLAAGGTLSLFNMLYECWRALGDGQRRTPQMEALSEAALAGLRECHESALQRHRARVKRQIKTTRALPAGVLYTTVLYVSAGYHVLSASTLRTFAQSNSGLVFGLSVFILGGVALSTILTGRFREHLALLCLALHDDPGAAKGAA
jgi:hypothetical protein